MIEFTTWDIVRNLLLAARWTIVLSAVAFLGGCTLGLAVLLMRTGKRPWLRRAMSSYIALFQGTPLLLQLFLVFFGLPQAGIRIEPFTAASLALALYSSAYLAEIWRSGVEAIPVGQRDAAASLGLRPLAQLALVIYPQALRVVRAPTVSFLVLLVKSTSLTSIIGFQELMRAANIINNATFSPLLVYGFASLIYFSMCFPLTRLSKNLRNGLPSAGR
jgi:polar amino acid transport system permease protein